MNQGQLCYRKHGSGFTQGIVMAIHPALHGITVKIKGLEYILKETEVISQNDRLAILEKNKVERLARRHEAYLESLKPIVLAFNAGCRTYAAFADTLGRKARSVAPCVRAAQKHGLIQIELAAATKKARKA